MRDKDGISAAVVVATLVSALKAEGKTVLDRFDELAREHGLYRTQPLTFRLEDPSQISGAMERLRSGKPAELAGSEVVEYADLRDGYGETPGTDGILIRTAADDRVIIRPSGTEPKLKCYLEVVRPVNGSPDWEAADARLDELSAATRKLCGF